MKTVRASFWILCIALAATAFRTEAQKSKSQEQGATIFGELCVGCHGPDGHANTDMGKQLQAADLTSDAVQHLSDSQLAKIIKNGQKKMPSFSDKLSDDDIKAVVTHVREFRKSH